MTNNNVIRVMSDVSGTSEAPVNGEPEGAGAGGYGSRRVRGPAGTGAGWSD